MGCRCLLSRLRLQSTLWARFWQEAVSFILHLPHPITSTVKSSMTGLTRSRAHISSMRRRASSGLSPSRSKSSTFPTRTSRTSRKPRPSSALLTDVPWGSRILCLSRISTRAFTGSGLPPGSARLAFGCSSPWLAHARLPPGSARLAFGCGSPWLAHARLPPGSARLAFGCGSPHHASKYYLVGFLDSAKVSPEAVLVEPLPGLHVPEATCVRADLIPQPEPAGVPPKLELEVHQQEPLAPEIGPQHPVDPERHPPDPPELLGRRQLEHADMLVVDHGVAERVGLVIKLEHGLPDGGALLESRALGQAARHHVAGDGLDLDDIEAAAQHLPVGERVEEMGRHPLLPQEREEHARHPVVDHALAHDGAALEGVERSGVVLEVLDDEPGLVGSVDDLRLAFVDLPTLLHLSHTRRRLE